MFQVESGIPMPAHGGGRKPRVEFPLQQMEPGDSFLIQCEPSDKKVVDSWKRALVGARRRYDLMGGDVKFRSLLVKDGLRVWRTK